MLLPVAIQSGSGNRLPLPLNAQSIKGKPKHIRLCSSSSSSSNNDGGIGGTEKVGVVVKPTERPRLVLKFIWMEKNIGIGIDQVIPGGHGSIPVSPYYFWPTRDAWAELKAMLERKPWISDNQMVLLLNQATDIINLWQQTAAGDGDLV